MGSRQGFWEAFCCGACAVLQQRVLMLCHTNVIPCFLRTRCNSLCSYEPCYWLSLLCAAQPHPSMWTCFSSPATSCPGAGRSHCPQHSAFFSCCSCHYRACSGSASPFLTRRTMWEFYGSVWEVLLLPEVTYLQFLHKRKAHII